MAASSRGSTPSSWGDGPSHALNPSQIDGSYTGATLPPYMDNEQNYGALLLLRISGVDRLGNGRTFYSVSSLFNNTLVDALRVHSQKRIGPPTR